MAASHVFSRFGRVFAGLTGAMVVLGAFVWYQIGALAIHQIGLYRLLGLFAALGLLMLGMSAVIAGLVVLSGQDQLGGWRLRTIRSVYFFGATSSLAALGLSLYYWTPTLAPRPLLIGVAAIVAMLSVVFAQYREGDQQFVTMALSRLGLATVAIPLLALPWVLQDYSASRVSRPLSGPLPAGAAVRPDAPSRIILVTFDGLRARSTSLHSPSLATTPSLVKLAKESTWFTRARSASDITLVCLPSIMTGISPSTFAPSLKHAMNLTPKGLMTGIPGYLRPAGYRSYYATMLLNPQAIGLGDEFQQGAFNSQYLIWSDFQTIDYVPLRETFKFLTKKLVRTESKEVTNPGLHQVPAVRRTFEQGREMMKTSQGRMFLWVHIGAPHAPYFIVPPTGPDAPLTPERYAKITQGDLNRANDAADSEGIRKARAGYEAYVAFIDRELGYFIDGLKQDGTWADSLVIVTSDHGENLVPRVMGHGIGPIRSDKVHVPLLVRRPRQTEARRANHVVSHLDIAPFVLNQVYGQVPATMEGVPLSANPPADRMIFSHGWFSRTKPTLPLVPISSAAFRGPHMYVNNRATGREALYHLDDEVNRHDLSARYPEVTRHMREQVQKEQAKFGPPPELPADFVRYVPLPHLLDE